MKLIAAIAAIIASTAVAFAVPAHADPGPPMQCGVTGAPACAGPGDPNLVCAIIAWRTMMPCNYWGMKVPQGTPGSWG
jgi:hypothetical protein